jgi:tripartite-type tricarboxylate transporter receptor subunit TctC
MEKGLLGTLLAGTVLTLGLAMPGVAAAQAYPAKPVRMIVTFAAGGGADFVARAIAPKLSESLGQPVLVDNRPGANGALGADLVAKAAPDGYTLLLGAAGTMVVAPHLGTNMPFDPMKDLAPATLVAISPFVVTLNPSVKANSVRELIALAKANPGKINYGTSGTGGSPQLATELFKSMTGVNMVHVPYKGLAPALIDLIGGQIQVVFADVGLVKGHIAGGKLKGLAVTSAARSGAMPELPTVAETGVPGYAAGTWYGILAPAGTPANIVSRVSTDTRKALALADIKAAFAAQGIETAGDTPEKFAGFMREEFAKWGKVIREAGIKAQ